MPFAHLRARSDATLFEGLISPKELVELAKENGHEAVALTDLRTMTSVVAFQKEAEKAGIKPIIGLEIWLDTDLTDPHDGDETNPAAGLFGDPRLSSKEEPPRLLLLAENEQGYKNLMAMVSRANRENMIGDRALVKQSWLRDGLAEGLVALTGDPEHSELPRAATLDDKRKASDATRKVLDIYQEIFGDRLFLEVSRDGRPSEERWVNRLVRVSAARKVPLVATHPVLFARRKDFFAHEVRSGIILKNQVNDPNFKPVATREDYYRSTKEMEELFSDIPEAVQNAAALAERCTSVIPTGMNHLPSFPLPEGERDLGKFFERQAWEGLEARLKKDFPDEAEREAKRPGYEERLRREVGIIQKMGFPGYFLVVSEFIRWSKSNGIYVGPGRGSGAGSLVAYALNITDIDPIPLHLLFERFLNPERVSMPDIDIDFDGRRDETIHHLFERYGDTAVSQVLALQYIRAKEAVRGAGRALGMPYKRVDEIARLIPARPLDLKLREAVLGSEKEERKNLKVDRLAQIYERDRTIRKLLDVAMAIEDRPKGFGLHAGGVVISPTVIEDFAPVQQATGKSVTITQFDKNDVETAGLIKFDLLGLSSLDTIHTTLDLINSQPHDGDPLTMDAIGYNDKKALELMAEGDTFGVFQFESDGMIRLLRELKPDRFEDIMAAVSLYRPGPMDLIPSFVRRKHGLETTEYPDPRVEDVLKETYGIMVYQEQVMQMAQIVGGYTLGGADLLRRAMGKKKVAEMVKHRAIFREGAVKNGVPAEKADAIFAMMEKFAGYGFNKSHAAAYAKVSMCTAYLKAHHTEEFLAGWMTCHRGNTDKLAEAMADARAHDIPILPPDINESSSAFDLATAEDGRRGIRYALTALKGVGEPVVRDIIAARNAAGPFESLKDFLFKFSTHLRSLGKSTPIKTAAEALVRAGAFDRLHPDRAQTMAALPGLLDYMGKVNKQAIKSTEAGDVLLAPMWDMLRIIPHPAPKLTRVSKAPLEEPQWPKEGEYEPWSELERLKGELESVGFYLSGHPATSYYKQLGGLETAYPLREIDRYDGNPYQPQLLAGMLESVRVVTTKKTQKMMAFITIGDGVATHDAVVFPQTYSEIAPKLVEGSFVGIAASIRDPRQNNDADDDEVPSKDVLVDRVWSHKELEATLAGEVHLSIDRDQLGKLKEVWEAHRLPVDADQDAQANAPITFLYLPDPANKDRVFRTQATQLKWNPSPQTFQALRDTFGDQMKMVYKAHYAPPERPRPNAKPRQKDGAFRTRPRP